MILRFVILALFFFTACRSDRIHCPRVKAPKMKESRVRHVRSERKVPESLSASVKPKKTYHREEDKQAVHKSPEQIEEWDCPRPGKQKNTRIIKENRKRMEKNMRLAIKKRSEVDSADFVLPPAGNEK